MRHPLLLGLTLFLAACGTSSDSSGPSESDIAILSETLVGCVSSGRFCCVRTRLANNSDRDLDVSIRWRAFNAQGVQFADALDFIPGVAAHRLVVSTSAYFGAHVESCSQISRFERFDVDVYAF